VGHKGIVSSVNAPDGDDGDDRPDEDLMFFFDLRHEPPDRKTPSLHDQIQFRQLSVYRKRNTKNKGEQKK
jgi:hypothetical protein